MSERRWEYKVTQPILPSGATSPVMGEQQVADWLNRMDEQGWEFVGYAAKHWHDIGMQEWWIFRRPVGATKEREER